MADVNYKVAVAMYGKYTHGSIIPGAVPVAYGSKPDELVRMGVLVATHEPCNCAILAEETAPSDPTTELVLERNDFRERASRAERAEQVLIAQVEGKDKEIAARDEAIKKLVSDNGRLELRVKELGAELDKLKAENKDLTKELDSATAPAKK